MNVIIGLFDYLYALSLFLQSKFHRAKLPPVLVKSQVVIVVPGLYESPEYFKHLQKSITDRSVIYSTSLTSTGGSIESDAKAIASYMKFNKLENVTVIGHSKGGLVAVMCMKYSTRISTIIAVASPFHGSYNGVLIRTKMIRSLQPGATGMDEFTKLSSSQLAKVVSIYPSFDNQIWNSKGSYLKGARNIELSVKGHHLVLRSKKLTSLISELLNKPNLKD